MNDDDGGSNAGAVYLVLGDSIGTPSSSDLGNADVKLYGEKAFDLSGQSVASAGDVDGDDLDDILIGANYNDTSGTNAGAAYLVLGSSLTSTPIDLADADYTFLGESSGDVAGSPAVSAGDIDGDGLSDIFIGAHLSDNSYGNSGTAYLFFGDSLGSTDTIDLGDADYMFYGGAFSDNSAYSLASAGDINGDGLDDLLISAHLNDTGGTNAGMAYLLLAPNTCNTAPLAPTISIDPVAPQEGVDDLICIIEEDSYDADGDSVTYSVAWTVNGLAFGDAFTTTETNDSVDASETIQGDEWTCTVTPNDGNNNGDPAEISVTIDP